MSRERSTTGAILNGESFDRSEERTRPYCRQSARDALERETECALPRTLQRLDAFELLILDDIGYVQQSADGVEVLFTLMAERYERRSLVITSNLVFGEWDRIFKDPMTTAAAIDRLVHRSVILEFSARSKRADEAESRSKNAPTEVSP